MQVLLAVLLAPFLFPISLGANFMEVLTGNIELTGGFCEFIGLVWNTMTVWL